MNQLFLLVLLSAAWASPVSAQTLDAELQQVPAKELAAQARTEGDAVRGAVVFFQPHMACSKCHSVGGSQPSALGPDLAKLEKKDVSDESLVESVLLPSKVIRKGFESLTIVTSEGKSLSGLLVERTNEKLVLCDLARGGETTTLLVGDLDDIKANPLSIMPAGQVNQLASRQQFLDLIRYLFEIRDGGAARAKKLQPSPTLLLLTLPEYEKHIDHAGLIRDWNAQSLQRGEAIYRRVCQNCHGTKEQPGSLPMSLRFAEGKFKNGSDPLAMYQTLTRGFGLMAAQTWMVPSQKYDVIHYLRETYLRPHNSSQLVAVNDDYLARLPKGDTHGPEPSKIEPWSAMDYGPSLTHTFEIPGGERNFAYNGIAVRLDPGAGGVSRGRHWMLFDTDTLRVAAAWSARIRTRESSDRGEKDNRSLTTSATMENFIDWRGIQFNGEHQIHPRVVGEIAFANGTGPGWANPTDGLFRDDQRVEGRDGRRYGPLPRDWGKFRGLYHYGQQVVLSYSVGKTDVLESPRLMIRDESPAAPLFLRTFNIGPRDRDLILQVANPLSGKALAAGARQSPAASALPLTNLPILDADQDLKPLTLGGPARWTHKLTTVATMGPDNGPFAADVLTAPESNPWLAQTRFTGLDFFADGRIAVCSWDGDVGIVESQPGKADLRWQRIATGLFQPLGLKIVGEKIHVTCRDQLAVLHDLNGDDEIDFYECLNNDHQVTEHFHEFAMGLQSDADGNFYYAKSARHALPAVVPHHGTLLRVTRDGSRTDILANGFRAANGVCLNTDGSFVVTDQEGHWNPQNRINWVTLSADGKPKFYGNMFGYHDVTDAADSAMQPPLCWITNAFDRSPGELLWVNSDRWGKLNGSLLNLSYGYGKVFLVPHETIDGQKQRGLIELPIPAFPTGVMRGRFHPTDGQLYLCGMFAWAGSATHLGGLYRLRATGQPMHLPVQLHATSSGLKLTFTEPLDPNSIAPDNVQIKTWSLKRTAKYGSDHHDERPLPIRDTSLSAGGKTLTITADLQPTWCMEIRYSVKSTDGRRVEGTIHNTIHRIREE